MDRFRFRVWDTKDKEYLDPNYYEDCCLLPDGSPHVGMTIYNGICDEYQAIPPKQLIVEQCTGLKDKNGKLIYEGDIVLINKKRKRVYWFNGAFFSEDIKQYEFNGADPAPLHYWLANGYDIEVIGNVHEIK